MTNNNIKFDWDEFQNDFFKKEGNNLIKYILNEKNRRITSTYINATLNKYGIEYEIKNIKIFQIAMTHPSYIPRNWDLSKYFKQIFMGINLINGDRLIPISDSDKSKAIPLGNTSYERLEFMGDSIISQIISDYIFMRYKDMQEGSLTKLRSKIENGTCLADICKKIELNKFVLISRNYEIVNARQKNDKILCDIFEAFIAALFFDACSITYDEIGIAPDIIKRERGNAYNICYNFVVSLIEDEIDLTQLLETDINYKDELLQQFHKRNWGDPKYGTKDVIVHSNKMGRKEFVMYVRDIDRNIIGCGKGSSKQKGEKIAAKKALQSLKVLPEDDDDEIIDSNSSQILFK